MSLIASEDQAKHSVTQAGRGREVMRHVTWISDLILAKWVSMAPPVGKFWLILFISWVKQL